MTKKIAALCAFVTLSLVTVVAYAQSAVSSDDPVGLFTFLLDKLRSGDYAVAFGAVLVGVVWLVRRLAMVFKVEWFSTRLGGWVLNFGTAAVLAVGTAVMASGSSALTFSLFTSALSAALVASGGWQAISDIIASRKKSE